MKREEQFASGTGTTVTATENADGTETIQINATTATTSAGDNQSTPVDLTVDNSYHEIAVVTLTVPSGETIVDVFASVEWDFSIGGGGGQTVHFGISVNSLAANAVERSLSLNANANIGGSVNYRDSGLSPGSYTFRILAKSSGSQAGLAESAMVGDILAQVHA